jgi:autotransporter-associated beta strand protein
MKVSLLRSLPPLLTSTTALLLWGMPSNFSMAATFTWANVNGNFTDAASWMDGIVPSGTNATDVLVFGGNVGSNLTPTNYVASSNSAISPFLINQLQFTAANAAPGTGPVDTINGPTPLLLGGNNPSIVQSGTASFVINAPIQLGGNLTLSGATVLPDPVRDNATVTFNGAISGNFDIIKNGTSTFRLGSPSGTSSSENTWIGNLIINDGTIRFNNNAYTAPTALRANAVTLNSATALVTTQFKELDTNIPPAAGRDPLSSLRMGTLIGAAGTVEGRRESTTVGAFDSVDIVLTALKNGSFGGTVRNIATGEGDTGGMFTVRGNSMQTLTGTLEISKDVEVGGLATLTFAGGASLGTQTAGAIVMAGGNFRLDNAATNNLNRLRDGDPTSTGVESVGGGTFSLVGNASGSSETISRLQLGSPTASRSGALTINVTHNSTSAITQIVFQSYSREHDARPLDTVNFTANNGSGQTLNLGTAGNGPRIFFNSQTGTPFVVPLSNGLLRSTGAFADATTVGWATVNGTDFATHGNGANGTPNGIGAVAIDPTPLGTTAGDATKNIALMDNFMISNAAGYAVNSLKLAPSAPGQTLDINTLGSLRTNAFLLAGTTDFTIDSSGGGAIANAGADGPRYFHVPSAVLTVNAGVNGVQAPVVKSGAGTLVLTSSDNRFVNQHPTVINEGTLRATPGLSLPGGELRFRGGVLEITGGGTLSRQVSFGSGKLNWNGIDALSSPISQERGSGGFSAFGADATVDLSTVGGGDLNWEDNGFVNSGYALLFGSTRANAKVTWVDNIRLTSVQPTVNYNAREFRAIDNPASTADVAVLSGIISGTVHDDFLKTGNGELILTGSNSYQGATHVTDGTLRVNGATVSSFLTDVSGTGTLGGNGSVGPVQVEAGGTVAPGNLVGNASILNTGAFRFVGPGAKLSIELGGTIAGGNNLTGYDQVNVTGGGISLSGAQLTGSLLNNFTPAPADLFFIMINDGNDPVQGMFAQGTQVTIGGQTFNISYAGNFTGTIATSSFTGGNDVVLQIVPEPGVATLSLLGLAGIAIRRRRM